MAHLRLPSTPEARAPVISRALHAIGRSDPRFDSQALLRELPGRFSECSLALAGDDTHRLRNCLTPALFERWSAGEALQASSTAAPSAGSVSVEDVRLVWVEHGADEDRLVVGIDCLGDADGTPRSPTVYWVLLRRAGVQTPPDQPGECPDCGAPSTEEETFCQYCASALGPLRTWLLDEAVDEVDWYDGPAQV